MSYDVPMMTNLLLPLVLIFSLQAQATTDGPANPTPAPQKCEVLLVGDQDRSDVVDVIQTLMPKVIPGLRHVAAARLDDFEALHRLLTIPSKDIALLSAALLNLNHFSRDLAPETSLARAMRTVRAAADDERKLTVCLIPKEYAFPGRSCFYVYFGRGVVVGAQASHPESATVMKLTVDSSTDSPPPAALHMLFLTERAAEGPDAANDFVSDFINLASKFDTMSKLNAWVMAQRSTVDQGAQDLLSNVRRTGDTYGIDQGFAELLLEAQATQAQLDADVAGKPVRFARVLTERSAASLVQVIDNHLPLARIKMNELRISQTKLLEWSRLTMAKIIRQTETAASK